MEEKKLEESAKSKIHVISQKELLLIFWHIKAYKSYDFKC